MPTKICICENENIIALDIKNCLNKIGYESVYMLNDRKKLLQQIDNEVPHLIILDVLLNDGVNGFDVAEEILKNNDIPIIFITGAGSGEYKKSFIQNKNIRFIKKPFDEESLRSAIDALLKK
jgi:DNA-binding response OmpR family regulator